MYSVRSVRTMLRYVAVPGCTGCTFVRSELEGISIPKSCLQNHFNAHTHTLSMYIILYIYACIYIYIICMYIFMNHRIMYNISSGRIYGRLWHMITHVPRCQRDS